MRARRLRAAALALLAAVLASPAGARPMTVDDVLRMQRLDRVAVSPDGALVAAVVLRPALPGEVYGRTAYEVDPSRADVWVIDRATGAKRDLTRGGAVAAGAWCATWSPDGQRLAFLSTRPEGAEPRGGDNVRLHVWTRGAAPPRRLGNWAVATQTRYGGAIRKLDIAGPNASRADACTPGEDDPPFAWLDARRLLVAALPPGATSGLLDETDRVYRHTAATREALRAGRDAMVSAAGSGAERTGMSPDERLTLAVVDAETGARDDVADVPAYPFHGALGVRVSPDGRRAAVLATVAMAAPRADALWARNNGEWQVEKRLGLVELADGRQVRWMALPDAARLPGALEGWSADGRSVAFTARARLEDASAARFGLDAAAGDVAPMPRAAAPIATPPPSGLPPGAELIASDAAGLVWRETTPRGVFVRASSPGGGQPRELLALNTRMADVDLGRAMLFDYPGVGGAPLKAAVLLPPGYKGGRLPVITWVYGGYVVRGADDYFLDPYMPGLYNLRLYAARGYAVLIPSIPLKRDGTEDHLTAIAPSVLPAVDRLVAMGIADPGRIGVMGQSYGGYTALALATQTDRFRAVAALASLSDLGSYYGAFDPNARGYPGIEHEKSVNPMIAELTAPALRTPFHADPERYWRNSPLRLVGRVTAPVLLVHGEHDIRGTSEQSEAFFTGLRRQGKTARILRYWGENHSLAASPATVRDVVRELLAWFDRHLAGGPKPAGAPPRP